MRVLQYLGVWHIFIAVLILCAHQSFIALCHESGSPSSFTASSKQKMPEGTDPSGSQTDHAKAPSDDKKDDVNFDLDSDDEQDAPEQTKDSEGKPIVSAPGSSVSNKQDDTSRPLSQDSSSGVDSPSQTGDATQQQTQSLQQEDGVESGTGTKGDPGQENVLEMGVQGVVLSEGGSEVKEEVESVVDAKEEVSENSEAVEKIPVTKNPSTLPKIIDIPPEPLPAAAPATVPSEDRSSEDKIPEESKQESSEGAQEVKDVESTEPEDDKGVEQKEPKEDATLEVEEQPKVSEESPKPTDEKQQPSDAPEETAKDKPDEEDKEKPVEQPSDGEQQPAEDKEPGKVEEKENVEEGERDQKPPVAKVEEEMPSFDEWKEKMLQEEEQKKREQARLASLEKSQGQASKSPTAPPVRPKLFKPNENSKNHASGDCGAKLLTTNKEAQSASAILNINPDLYMLNPCTANIKFVVELCEPIQIKQIEIANYELFSSVPEKFRVSISDRYPAREWHQLGIYVAQNERVLQSFPIPDEQMFAKYMKFEMLSFFGSEHYCPLSVLRVFGTNVVEEIEDADTVDDVIDSPPEYLPVHPTPLPDDLKQKNGLLESAKDVVIGLVQRAAKVLAGREDAEWKDEDIPCFPEDATSNQSGSSTSDIHPSDPAQLPLYEEHLEICMPSIYKQCVGVDIDFSSMRQLCGGRSCCFCPNYAERFEYCRHRSKSQDGERRCCTDSSVCGLEPSKAVERKDFVDQVEPPSDVVEDKVKVMASDNKLEDHKAADNDLATDKVTKTNMDNIEPTEMQSQTRTNVDVVSTKSPDDTQPKNDDKIVSDKTPVVTTAPKLDKSHSSLVINVSSLRDIEPTKSQAPTVERTKEPNGIGSSSASVAQSVVETKSEVHKLEPTQDINQGTPPAQISSGEKTPNLKNIDTEKDASNKDSEEVSQNGDSEPTPAEKVEDKASKVPTTKSETTSEGTQKTDVSSSSSTTPPAPKPSSENGNGVGSGSVISSGGIFIGQQKESVFMRLNNRIKDLELNMSLSSRYLEELSQRYKKQMDEMQKAFNKTITTLTDNAQTAHNKDTEQQKYIDKLENQLVQISSQLVNTTLRLDNVLREVIERHLFLMFIEILAMSLLFLFCIGGRPSKIYIPVENGVPHTVPHTVQNHVGHPVPADVAKRKPGDDDGEGRAMHASPRRRNRSFGGECTPAKASATNTGGGSCDDLLIIGHTTPYLEAIQQVKSPDGVPRRKGKHKSRHKVAPKSSSTTAVPLTNGDHHEGTRIQETNQAGLLFKGSASKGDTSPEARGYSFPNSAIKRLFSSSSIDRIEELSSGGATTKQNVADQMTSYQGPKLQHAHKPKQQKVDGSSAKHHQTHHPTLKHSSASASNLQGAGHQKQQGKGAEKKSRSSPALQQINSHQNGPGRPSHKTKKASPHMNGKR